MDLVVLSAPEAQDAGFRRVGHVHQPFEPPPLLDGAADRAAQHDGVVADLEEEHLTLGGGAFVDHK